MPTLNMKKYDPNISMFENDWYFNMMLKLANKVSRNENIYYSNVDQQTTSMHQEEASILINNSAYTNNLI